MRIPCPIRIPRMPWSSAGIALSLFATLGLPAYAGTLRVDFDDGSVGLLAKRGTVSVVGGKAYLGPSGSALEVPFLPYSAHEPLMAQFTVHNMAELRARDDFAFGWEAGFYAGAAIQTTGSNFQATVGAFDHAWVLNPGACVGHGEVMGAHGWSKVSIRLVADPTANTTSVFAAYDEDAATAVEPGTFHLVDEFPWGTWVHSKALRIINWTSSLVIDDVIVTGGAAIPDNAVDGADTPFAGTYAQWRVRDVHANTPFLAAGPDGSVAGAGLTLTQQHASAQGVWSYECTVSDTRGTNRATTLALCIPLDARGWSWWDDPERRRTISGAGLFQNITEDYYGARPMTSRYPIAVLDNGATALCLAVPAEPGRAVRFVYDSAQLELRAEFDFGLSSDTLQFPSRADAVVQAFEIPAEWAFRRGLDRFYELNAAALARRAGEGGVLLRGAPLHTIERPEDFHITWHDFAAEFVSVHEWSRIDQALGVQSYLYREPQTHWRSLRGALDSVTHIDMNDGSAGPLLSDGQVEFVNGAARIAPSAALRVPGFPTIAAEDLEAEFTLCNADEVLNQSVFDLGWQGRFWSGLRKTAATSGRAMAGAFDFSSQGPQNGEGLDGRVQDRITVKLVASRVENVTRVYVGFDENARHGDSPPRLHLAGYFPWGSWTGEPTALLYLRNYAPVAIVVDDVIITRFTGDPPATYETYRAQLAEDAQRGDTWAQSTLVSGSFDADGRYNLYLGDNLWTRQVPFGVNPAPHVTNEGFGDWPNRYDFERNLLSTHLGWTGAPSTMKGMYFDSMQGWGNLRNYRREHWRESDYPLTFDRTNGNAVCLQNIWSIVAAAKALSETLHAHGQLMMGNDVYYQMWFHMPYVDIAGREISNYQNGVWSPPSDETYLYFRAMAGRRPFWTLMNDTYDDGTHMEEYFQRSLFYGIFPSMYHAHDGISPWYWATPAYYDRDRPLFQKYIPMIRALDNARWEPVPHARVTPATVRIERFGNVKDDTLAFTLHNPGSATTASVRVLLTGLGARSATSGVEWVTGAPVQLSSANGEAEFSVPLGSNAYAVVGLRTIALHHLTGDVDRSGAVNAIDVQLVVNQVLGIDTGFDCDVNGDGKTNALDIQVVVNAVLGVIPSKAATGPLAGTQDPVLR